MSDFLVRLKQERDELQERQDKLRKFIYSPAYDGVSALQQECLASQSVLQEQLLAILNTRINDLDR